MTRGLVTSLVVALLLTAGPARAGEAERACIAGPVAADLAAKVAFQDGMRDLMATARPDLADLITLNRDLQVALAEARALRLDWLALEDPDRLRPLSADGTPWRGFAWDEADEVALRAADPRYLTLSTQAQALATRSDGHPDWPALRDYMRSSLRNDPGFRDLTRDLVKPVQDMDDAMRACLME